MCGSMFGMWGNVFGVWGDVWKECWDEGNVRGGGGAGKCGIIRGCE